MIVEHDFYQLQNLLGEGGITPAVEEMYDRFQECYHRVASGPLPPACLLMIAGLQPASEPERDPIPETTTEELGLYEIDWANCPVGHPVTAMYQGSIRDGHFRNTAGKNLHVELVGDEKEYRVISPDQVQLGDTEMATAEE